MEDVMPAQFQVWLERPPRPRRVSSYVRKPVKVIKCKDEFGLPMAGSNLRFGAHASPRHHRTFSEWIARTQFEDALVRQLTADWTKAKSTTEERFSKLADEWSSEVGNISSLTVMTTHPKYQEIIALGWDVVPFLLRDLQRNRGFWFTALNAITGIRPFDPSDAGNSRRMTDAWIKWGKRKGII